jgi:hypothetical protein
MNEENLSEITINDKKNWHEIDWFEQW